MEKTEDIAQNNKPIVIQRKRKGKFGDKVSVHIWIQSFQAGQIDKIAAATGTSQAQVIREAIAMHVNEMMKMKVI